MENLLVGCDRQIGIGGRSKSNDDGYRHGEDVVSQWSVLVMHADSGFEQTVLVLGRTPEIAMSEARRLTHADVVEINRVEIQ